MITNEKQLAASKKAVANFRESLSTFDAARELAAGAHPAFVKAQQEQLSSELGILEADIREYEALKAGDVSVLEAPSLQELAGLLIKARIARGSKLEALYRKRGLLSEAVTDMDMDLQALRSTAPQWRAWQMYDRVKARRTISDRINERLRLVWDEPIEKLKDRIAGWFLGDQ